MKDQSPDDATAGLEARRRVLRDLRVRDDAAVSATQIDQLLDRLGFTGKAPPTENHSSKRARPKAPRR